MENNPENKDQNRIKSGKKEIIESLNEDLDPMNEEKEALSDENESMAQDLKYDEDENTFQYDVESMVTDYKHPDPYDTTAADGEDMDSDWDEANQYVGDEYEKDLSLESEVEDLGMHIDEGQTTELDPLDEKLSETPEDKRKDLDEEGYPKNDSARSKRP